MAHSLVQEEDLDVVNYDQAAKENTNFYRVVYTSRGQTVLSAIPPGGMSSQRRFKNTDVIIDVVDGEGIATIRDLNSNLATSKFDRTHHVVVDDGEFFTIKNIHPDRWLKMIMHFTDRVMPEGAVYPTDPYPAQASMSPVAISPTPIRTTIQVPVPQAIPYASTPVTTVIAHPVTNVTSPLPVQRPNSPLIIEPSQFVSTPVPQPTQFVQYQQVPVTQSVPVMTTTRTFVPQQIPSFPSGSSINAPKLPTVNPLI